MGINVVLKGEGDMKKSTYDPDEDGIIAITNTEADMKKSIYDSDEDNVIEGSNIDLTGKAGCLRAEHIPKKASNTLRHSHDSIEAYEGFNWALIKKITFTYGIKGILRIKFDMKNWGIDGTLTYGRIYKNSNPIGNEQIVDENVYHTYSEDIDVGTIKPGGSIELWGKNASGAKGSYKNFRIYYDNDIPEVVDSSNS